jgi:hypothetical protein
MLECKSCHTHLGDAPKVLPMRVDGGDEDWETFCPPCFVHIRAPLEPLRFTGQYVAVHCAGCGYDSVAAGLMRCGNCGKRTALVALPAKGSGAAGFQRDPDLLDWSSLETKKKLLGEEP